MTRTKMLAASGGVLRSLRIPPVKCRSSGRSRITPMLYTAKPNRVSTGRCKHTVTKTMSLRSKSQDGGEDTIVGVGSRYARSKNRVERPRTALRKKHYDGVVKPRYDLGSNSCHRVGQIRSTRATNTRSKVETPRSALARRSKKEFGRLKSDLVNSLSIEASVVKGSSKLRRNRTSEIVNPFKNNCKDETSKPRKESIVINSDDEDTFYMFSTDDDDAATKDLSRSNRKLATMSRHTRNVKERIPKQAKQTSTQVYRPATRPLSVVCDSSALDSILMGPPPSPFPPMKNSAVRPVDRIPISPYTKSPQFTNGTPATKSPAETPHLSHRPTGQRTTRSSPRRVLQAVISTPTKPLGSKGGRGGRGKIPSIPYPPRSVSPTNSERRLSIRQTECAFKYTDILVKKSQSFTQVILNTSVGRQKNLLTVKALQELTVVLNNAKYDDTSSLILITGSDNGTFCSGLDLTYLTTGDIHLAARTMSEKLGDFVRAALSFPKPLVAAVNGQAVGCGVAILPLFDVVYASDKATFFTPYTLLGQVPEAGLSCSLPLIIGMALANEMLMAGRMLTALEAYQMGLVAQVFWPTSMMQEVIPRITNMATSCSSRILNATKSLIRSQQRGCILTASQTEASMLSEIWSTPECQRNIKLFLEHQ